jgi:hypothetical protein
VSFSASYDSTTKIISAVVLAILVAVAALTQSAAIAGLGVLVVILCFAYSPQSYAVADGSIVVNRLIGNVRIPLDAVREVRLATADDFRGCLRLWGSGGLFGYCGIFQMPRLGKATWYLTNRNKAVIVITEGKTVLLSPDNVDDFVRSIPATATAGFVPSIQPQGSGARVGKLIGLAVGIAAIAFASFAFLYSPGPPSYTLTPQSLVIHDRFYPVTVNAASVDVDRIRIVDVTTDADWRPTARTNGFANSHYRSGWFRVANGQKVRLYRADSRRLVLLPPKGDGAPVLLETRDPEGFVTEVRHEWSPPL